MVFKHCRRWVSASALAILFTTSAQAKQSIIIRRQVFQPLPAGTTGPRNTTIHPVVVKNPNLKCQAPDLKVIKSGKATFWASVTASSSSFTQNLCEDKAFVTNLLLKNLSNPNNTIEFCGADQLHQFSSQGCTEQINTDDLGRPTSKDIQIPINWECYRCNSANKDDCVSLDVTQYRIQEINSGLRRGTIQVDSASKSIQSKVEDYNGGQWMLSNSALNQVKDWLQQDRGITFKTTIQSKGLFNGAFKDRNGNLTGGGPNGIGGVGMMADDSYLGKGFGLMMFISPWNNGIDQFQRHLCFARTRSNFIDYNGWLNYGVKPKNASEDFMCYDLGRDVLADQQYEASITVAEGTGTHYVSAFQGQTFDEQDYYSGKIVFPDSTSSDLIGGKFGMANYSNNYQMGSMIYSIRSGRATAANLPALFHVEGEVTFINPRVCPYMADPVAAITSHTNGGTLKNDQEAFEFRFIGTAKDKKATCEFSLQYLGKDGSSPTVLIDKKSYSSIESAQYYPVAAMPTKMAGYYRAQLSCTTTAEKKKIIVPVILKK